MNPELEKLIDLSIADGNLTDKKKEFLDRKAKEFGVDQDELEIILEGKLHLVQKTMPQSSPPISQKEPIEILKQMDVPFSAHGLCYYCGKGNNIATVELLLKAGMSVDIKHEDSSAIENACISGNNDILKLLIKNGVNINVQDKDCFTPLMRAVQYEHLECVKTLIENNADLNIKNKQHGANAISIAMLIKNQTIVELLKNAGAQEIPEEEFSKLKKLSNANVFLHILSLFKGWRVWLGIFFIGCSFVGGKAWGGPAFQDEYEGAQLMWLCIGIFMIVFGIKKNLTRMKEQ